MVHFGGFDPLHDSRRDRDETEFPRIFGNLLYQEYLRRATTATGDITSGMGGSTFRGRAYSLRTVITEDGRVIDYPGNVRDPRLPAVRQSWRGTEGVRL